MANTLKLQITGPDGATRDVTHENAESLIIGSGPAAAVRVEDPRVSAMHCMLKVDKNQVTVIDLGSETGTMVGQNKIKGTTNVAPGDVLAIGSSKVTVVFGEAKAAPKAETSKNEAKVKQGTAKKEEVKSAASATGAYGNVARLFNEELPPEETPAPDNKQLEVAMLWGDTIINVKHFNEDGQVTVGASGKNDFQVFAQAVGESFPLVTTAGNECRIAVPAAADLILRRGDSEKSRERLQSEGALTATDGAVQGHALKIELHDRVQVNLENTSFIIRWVRPHKMQPIAGATDFYFTKILTTSGMACIVLLAAIFMTDINAESLSEDLFKNPQRFTKFVIKPPAKEEKKLKDLSGIKEGAKAQKDEGKFGKKEAKKDDADPSKKGAPKVDANKREEDRKKVMQAGLLGALGGADGAASNVFGPGGMGTGINNALGGLKGGAGVGDAHGVGGLGSRGTGPGGGGTGLGLGGLGTKGSGRGAGGYGSIDLGGRGKGETRVVPGKTTVTGSCERTVIAKVIGRHANEIRYCYEVELSKDPNLAGKVGVTFTIDPTGGISDAAVGQSTISNNNVEQCMLTRIRRWKFPEPKGGGVCVINYPWVFKAAGGGDDEE